MRHTEEHYTFLLTPAEKRDIVNETAKTTSDRLVTLLLLLGVLFYSVPFLNGLEFFRHTEADRTLIAWEMAKSGNFLVPHLLGDIYLTKPPLFYWLLASLFSFADTPYEWLARIPTAIFGALLVGMQFIALRYAGLTQKAALLGALILATTVAFFSYSTDAEIDMLHTFFCTAALYCGFLFINTGAKPYCFLLATLSGMLAVLIKGPPIFLFYTCGVGTYLLVKNLKYKMPIRYIREVLPHLIVLILIALALLTWAYFVTAQVSLEVLIQNVKHEIFARALEGHVSRVPPRGSMFYIPVILGGLLPWSLLLFSYLGRRIRGSRSEESPSTMNGINPKSRDILIFSLSVIVPSLIVFSLSKGKASRYILPLFPFLANVILFEALKFNWILRKRTMAILITGLFLIRVLYSTIYAEFQHSKHSVREIALDINNALPAGEAIYTIEMFERWLPYYLIRNGRAVLRLTPSNAALLGTNPPARIYYLLSGRDEVWRLSEIKTVDESTKIIQTYKSQKSEFLLVESDASKAKELSIKSLFPTQPSKAFPISNVPN